MTSPERRAALRQMITDLSIMTVLGVVLALIGPFGSFSVPFAWRLVYWVGLGWSGYACYRPIAGTVLLAGRSLELPEAASWGAASLIATVPMTVLVWLIGSLPHSPVLPSLEQALTTYGYVLVIGSMITALFWLLERSKQVQPDTIAVAAPVTADPVVQAPAPARFFDRIPPRLGTDLVALEMEDHYVRIHTRLGSDLVLMRMRDAVAELDGIDGAQVHRSWWVARAAVQAADREGRNVRLKLDGGLDVPVARDAAGMLKAAGWF